MVSAYHSVGECSGRREGRAPRHQRQTRAVMGVPAVGGYIDSDARSPADLLALRRPLAARAAWFHRLGRFSRQWTEGNRCHYQYLRGEITVLYENDTFPITIYTGPGFGAGQ